MDAETITREELARALRDHMCSSFDGLAVFASPEKAAADLFEIAHRSREPEYELGRAYEDPERNIWVFGQTASIPAEPGWLRPGSSGRLFEFDVPRRPLRRLVPEPSWLPEAVIRAVADVLTEYTERERAEDATGRICKLIREGVNRG